MIAIAPVCINCKHFDESALLQDMVRSCKAFMEIPLEIWEGLNDHSQPLPNQTNNIVFEAKNGMKI